MSDRVVAVVVTFNRKAVLVKCLDALLRQTHPLGKILIIDNASSDGTRELLEQGGYLAHEKIVYHRMTDNLGGAGGFHFGLRQALEIDAGWFWLMDDDVAPVPDCLAQLLLHADVSECLHPRKLSLDGREFQWEVSFDLGTVRHTTLANPSFRNGKAVCFVTVGCFEGMLISRRVVDAIGLPDPKYFISWDDTLYGTKASTYTSVAFVRDAILQKTLGDNPTSPWKTYYVIRNKYFVYRDIMEYFGLEASKADLLIFHFIRVVEALQSMLRGWRFVRPTLRGMVDGLAYLRAR